MDQQESDLGILDLIQVFVEALDRCFENVCELIAFLDGGAKIGPDDSLSVAIGTDYRATLVVVGKRFARDSHGRVVWASVTRLKLTQISRLS